jgi:hypothetical protein
MPSHRGIREAEPKSIARAVDYDEGQDSQVAPRVVLDDVPNDI